jgi:hypothetical protein
MPSFTGFPSGKAHLTPIPSQFFSELMPAIDDLAEMKVTLYAFWFLDRLEAAVRYLTYADFAGDERLMKAWEPISSPGRWNAPRSGERCSK